MLQKLRERSSSESGFTLVELLVVMLILGLLAAIAIPSFFNQRDKAKDADAKESVRTAQTAIETFATDHGGKYTGATPADLVSIEATLSNVSDPAATPAVDRLHVDSATDDSYSVTVDSENTPNTFTIARASNGTLSYTCTVDGSDGCPSGGNWGQ